MAYEEYLRTEFGSPGHLAYRLPWFSNSQPQVGYILVESGDFTSGQINQTIITTICRLSGVYILNWKYYRNPTAGYSMIHVYSGHEHELVDAVCRMAFSNYTSVLIFPKHKI